MAKATQLIRGTAATNDKYTGPEGSLSYCTDTHSLRVHDGTVVEGEVTNGTMGGFEVPVLVEYQRPTPENNYTWYRKYSDGWVEQGGRLASATTAANSGHEWNVIFPIKMASASYNSWGVPWHGGSGWSYGAIITQNLATTGMAVYRWSNGIQVNSGAAWYVCGYAA